MRIPIASDHAGFELKRDLMKALPHLEWEDLGPFDTASVDYPDFADLVAQKLSGHPEMKAVLICGSGQGMAMRANKYPHLRAALVWHEDIARLSRQHNDANVLCLPGRFVSLDQAKNFARLFFETPFEGGRHAARVAKLSGKLQGGC